MFSSNLYFATLWFVTVKIYVFRIGWRSSPHIWSLYMVTIFQLKYGETNTYFVLPPKIHKTEIFPCLTAESGKKGLWVGAHLKMSFNHECTFVSRAFLVITFGWVCCCIHPKVMTGNGQLTKVQS